MAVEVFTDDESLELDPITVEKDLEEGEVVLEGLAVLLLDLGKEEVLETIDRESLTDFGQGELVRKDTLGFGQVFGLESLVLVQEVI